jgi:hypothetical protein
MSRTFLANVPVVPVLFALGRVADQRGRYWCPFHLDDRPGGKPSAEVHDDPTVLSCWSCGRDSRAPELVAEITGCSLEKGLDYALSVADEIEPSAKKRVDAVSAERLEAEYRRLTEQIRYPRDVDPVEAFAETRGWEDDLTSFARVSWGWRGDYRGRVLMPHRDENEDLTGIKWRVPPTWAKDGRKGSRFAQLYGTWRLGRATARGALSDRIAWITEGETDTVWAAWHLEPVGVEVLGAPTALYRPREPEIERLAGRRVVLAFDGDPAGLRGRQRWQTALLDVAEEIVTLDIPEGLDLESAPATPIEIWEKLR